MPLSWNEIRNRAHEFSKRWEGESSERAEAQSFWNDFFRVFGIERKRVAIFEKQVEITRAGHKLKHGRIDAFWKGVLLIEHKSLGQDLSRAFAQAADYFEGLPERDLPRYILVSDFAHFRLYDLEENTETEFKLADLHKRIKHFAFIAGYRTQTIAPQNPVNIKAAERMGKLHDALKAAGYDGHPLEVLLVRLLFCLFAEDTGIFQPASAFRAWIEERTAPDGSDLGAQLALLFQVLNTPEGRRAKTLDEQIAAFPFVNGKLFEETLSIASFDAAMRDALLDCCALDWSSISPAIFGALFQSIMDAKARRNLGAHYTSEENILKLIQPLFLDSLHEEFERLKGNRNKLFEFHKKLRTLTFFDPACGCGNFLVIAYRELRKLELDVLRASLEIEMKSGQRLVDIQQLIGVNVDQFYGIEIEEFPAQIAQVALWLMDHQMNVRVSEEFGMYFARIPLKTSPHIVNGNALTLDWNDVLPAERASYVFGNPPFSGKHYQSKQQKAELVATFAGLKSASDLDYVAAWYEKAARYMTTPSPAQSEERVKAAFVSTNSITQGEQVGILWGELLNKYHIKIHFAHRTFKWSNEASGKAAVHCVIIGFAPYDSAEKRIFVYDEVTGEPHEMRVNNISPYLTPGPDAVVSKRQTPLANVPTMRYGNKPTDDGNYILSDAERKQLIAQEPNAKKYIRPYMGSEDFINSLSRWCLWLQGIQPGELRAMPQVLARVERVKAFRLASSAEPTRKSADAPTLFFYISQPDTDYLVVPEVSSERRNYIPIGFMSKETICSNTNYLIPDASLFLFGMVQSEMHMAWMRTVGGRLKSDYRYSGSVVYNNFPWPDEPTDKQRAAVEAAAQAVLDARAQFPQSSLADLYDPLTMPPALVKAHQTLDRAVDACYRKAAFANDAQRVEFLFERYQQLTSLLPAEKPKRARKSS
ncbi:MAG: class I SAM-dependent DNA methyltransferase [Gallionellaceae bacterium]